MNLPLPLPVGSTPGGKYVILLISSDQKVQVLGDHRGDPFTQERAAHIWSRRYIKAYPRLQVLIVPITAISAQNIPLSVSEEKL